MEDVWKGRGGECVLIIPTARELFLLWSCVEPCYTHIAEGHMSAIVKRQDLNCKKDFKRSRLLIRIGACQRLFKWPVM